MDKNCNEQETIKFFLSRFSREEMRKVLREKKCFVLRNILPKTKTTSKTGENNSNQTFSIWYETKKEPDYSNYMMCIVDDKIKENGI